MSHPVWLLNKQSAQHQRRNEVQPNKAWALEWKAQTKQSRHDRYVMCSVVDFGPGWYNLSDAFGAQRKYNPPGKSPALCSEF